MFIINNIQWYIKFVPPYDLSLHHPYGGFVEGMCDSDTRTIYINETLRGKKLKKVLCHEIVHASMFSYGVSLSYDEEEILADIIATYGEEIIKITNVLFKKIKMER